MRQRFTPLVNYINCSDPCPAQSPECVLFTVSSSRIKAEPSRVTLQVGVMPKKPRVTQTFSKTERNEAPCLSEAPCPHEALPSELSYTVSGGVGAYNSILQMRKLRPNYPSPSFLAVSPSHRQEDSVVFASPALWLVFFFFFFPSSQEI